MRPTYPNALARALRGFFAEHLPSVHGASPHTVRSYRDALALLLRFLATRKGRPVVELDLHDVDSEDVLAFLDHLEGVRNNCVTTRNNRLAAIHVFARYVAARHPESIETCQRLLAVPFKRAPQRPVEYLEAEEIKAILKATDLRTVHGRRDHTILLTLFNTGARVQELLDVRVRDLQLDRPLRVRLIGKGRKERLCPLWPQTGNELRALIDELGLDPHSSQRVFRNQRGEPLTRFGVRYLLHKYAKLAQSTAPRLALKRVHPHIMRHSAAVHLLQAGVDLVTISHWLGHASVETTNRYVAVDLDTKRAALARAGPVGDHNPVPSGWRSDASILDWLEAL